MSLSSSSQSVVVLSPSSRSFSSSSSSSNSHHHSAIAGYAAGLTGTIVGYPLDTLKLWMQTNRVGENKHLTGASSSSSSQQQHQQQHQSSSRTVTITSSSGSSGGSSSSSSSFLRAGGTIRSSSPGSVGMSSSTSAAASSRHRMQSTIATTTAKIVVPTTTSSSSSTTTTFFFAQTRNALKKMKSNLQALYSGVSAPLVTVGFVQSINFAVYDSTRRYLFSSSGIGGGGNCDANYRSSDPIRNVAMAGFVSGTATAVVTAPLILIKTHQQITGSSFTQALQSLPVRGCRAGFVPHLVCETFGRSVYYATYETMKRTFRRMNNSAASATTTTTTPTRQQHDAEVSLGQRMVCAASSGIICWSLIFPLDSLRSRVYSEFVVGNNVTSSSNSSRSRSSSSRSSSSLLVQMIRKMHNEQSFYRGFRVTVLRAGPVAAVVLPVYDLVLDTLSSSSSSSSR